MEMLGQPEQFTWEETEDMYLQPDGMDTPAGLKIISSAPTVAALGLARVWLQRNN